MTTFDTAPRSTLVASNLICLASMVIWAAGLPAADLIIPHMPPVALTAARALLAAAFLLPVWWIVDGKDTVLPWEVSRFVDSAWPSPAGSPSPAPRQLTPASSLSASAPTTCTSWPTIRPARVILAASTSMWMFPAVPGSPRAEVMRHAAEPAVFDSLGSEAIAEKGADWVSRWTKVVLK